MVNNAQKTKLVLVSHNRPISMPSKISGIGPILMQIPGIGAAPVDKIRISVCTLCDLVDMQSKFKILAELPTNCANLILLSTRAGRAYGILPRFIKHKLFIFAVIKIH